MRRPTIVTVFCLALASGCAMKEESPAPVEPAAELPEPGLSEAEEHRDGPDRASSIESRLYPPELVLRHQLALELTAAQRETILTETRRTQNALVELEADLAREEEALGRLLESPSVDQDTATQAAKRMLALESNVKAAHFDLLVSVKNVLTKAQQERLDGIRGPRP